MAEYIFDRGKFGKYNIPAWAGQTRALKLVRLLVKQGYSGIVYEEGPLEFYNQDNFTRNLRHNFMNTWRYKDRIILNRIIEKGLTGQSPSHYKVKFKERQNEN